MYIVVDRILESFALCEVEENVYQRILLDRLPEGVKEGDVLAVEGDLNEETAVFSVDAEETRRRRERAEKLLEKLKRKNCMGKEIENE